MLPPSLQARLATLLHDTRGNVLILVALGLPLMIGAIGFGVELANDYALKVRNQGVADMAVLSSASVYAAAESQNDALAAARSIIRASGLAPDTAAIAIVPSPRDSSEQAVRLTFSTSEPYFFARIFGLGTAMTIRATAYAELSSGVTPCILALNQSSSTRGIYVSGGSTLQGASCDLVANSAIYAEGGSTIVGQKISSASTVSKPTYDSSITTSPKDGQIYQNQKVTADPLAQDATIAAALALLKNTPASLVPPLNLAGGPAVNLGYWPTSMTVSGHTGSLSNGVWTFPSGTYDMANLTIGGGLSVVFRGPVTLNVKGSINHGGTLLKIGVDASGTPVSGNALNVTGGFTVNGGSGAVIGDGTVNIAGTTYNQAPLVMGAGAHYFGTVHINGGTSLSMGDGPFVTTGNFTGDGSSSVTFGATATHYFGGNLSLAGNAVFGAGTYVIDGSFINNTTGTMTGSNVSFVVGGNWTMGGSAHVAITAPSATSGTGIPGYLLISTTTQPTTFTAGSNSIFSGIVYLPNSDLTVNSGGALSAGTANGACWTMITKTITVQGGARLTATQCAASGTSSGAGAVRPRLVR